MLPDFRLFNCSTTLLRIFNHSLNNNEMIKGMVFVLNNLTIEIFVIRLASIHLTSNVFSGCL